MNATLLYLFNVILIIYVTRNPDGNALFFFNILTLELILCYFSEGAALLGSRATFKKIFALCINSGFGKALVMLALLI